MATYTDNYNLIKPSYSEIADVAVINTNMNTIDDIMHSTQVSLAPAYDSTQTYNTGDVVMYELLMYKCTDDNVTGTWDASKWERTTASECGDGGSDVEANPSGTATEELNKLRVDNTIYSIPEGSEVVVYGEASGSIAEFDDGSNKPMSKCKIEINAVQDLHGYDSPWVGGSGKNKLPFPYSSDSTTINGVTFTVRSDGSIVVDGTASANAEFYLLIESEVNLLAGTYTLSGLPNGGGSSSFLYNFYARDADNNILFDYRTGTTSTRTVETAIKKISLGLRIIAGYTANNLIIYPQLELGSTATSYAPYSNICPISGFNGGNVHVSPTTNAQDGTTYSVSWQSQAGTVYGGNIDLVSGVLTVTHTYLTDVEDLTWTMETTSQGNIFSCNNISDKARNYNFLCNKYKAVAQPRQNLLNGEIGTYNSTNALKRFSICDNSFATISDFIASLSSLFIIYEVEKPFTYQLTPTQVSSLLGINNVWNDTNGETEVKYIRDLNTTVSQLAQHLTYGYGGTPSFNGNDGDVHIVLDSLNKKKGEFMWLNNQWTLIEGSGEVALKVYDNGVEGVAWSVTGGTKNATNISLNVGGGTFTNYAITDSAVNVTNYSTLTVICRYRDQNYTKVIDLTNESGNKYISFLYVTDSNHNECAVGLTDTNSPSPTYRVDSRNGGTAECIMYSCTLE